MGIYKRKQESKKTRKIRFRPSKRSKKQEKKERKHALGQESDQEKKMITVRKKEGKYALNPESVFLLGFLIESVFFFFYFIFFYKFSPLLCYNIYTISIFQPIPSINLSNSISSSNYESIFKPINPSGNQSIS